MTTSSRRRGSGEFMRAGVTVRFAAGAPVHGRAGTPAALTSLARELALAGPVRQHIVAAGDQRFHLEAGFQFLYRNDLVLIHDILRSWLGSYERRTAFVTTIP